MQAIKAFLTKQLADRLSNQCSLSFYILTLFSIAGLLTACSGHQPSTNQLIDISDQNGQCGQYCLIPSDLVQLDLNQSSALELTQIKGIGPKLSQQIVAEREHQPNGRYRNAKQLLQINGIGQHKLSQINQSTLIIEETTE